MTKHEADVIGGLNLTDQISNEAYKQIMIAVQDENEVGDVLDKIKIEIADMPKIYPFIDHIDTYVKYDDVIAIIDKYRGGEQDEANH